MSKGSSARPYSVPREQFDAAFDSIFKKRTPEQQAKEELGPYISGLTTGPNRTRMWAKDALGNAVELETEEARRLGTVGKFTPRSSPAHVAEEGGDTPEA